MKKIFTLLLVAGALGITAASAQTTGTRYDQYGNPVYQQTGQWDRNTRDYPGDYGYDNRRDRQYDRQRQAEYERQRQAEYDRQRQAEYERQRQYEYDQMNRDYDRRIDGYRKDRRMSRYERDRMIRQAEYERQQKAKAFGKGMVVAGAAAILLGVLMSGGR